MDKRRLRLTTILASARLVAIVGGVSLIAGCAVSADGTPSALAADPAPAAAQEQTAAAEAATGSESTASSEVDVADAAAAPTDAATQTTANQATETETASAEATGEAPATAEPAPELVESSQATTEVAAVAEEAISAEPAEVADAETTETEASAVTALAETQDEPETTSVFARLFSAKKSDSQAAATTTPPASSQETAEIVVEDDETEATDPETDAGEIAATDGTTTASIGAAPQRASLEVAGNDAAPLPGVREVRSLYQISARDSFDYTSFAEDNGTIEVASAAGLAGLAGGRLAVQHEKVDVACLKPSLRATLKRIESHFGRQVVVTSGYRSRSHNRRVGGAPESRHMACEAADIKIAGVSKWQIAEYARAMPGRGGVGTYCHTDAVHVDVGPKRDWNWRCARRRK